jgi:hypothetical protein
MVERTGKPVTICTGLAGAGDVARGRALVGELARMKQNGPATT